MSTMNDASLSAYALDEAASGLAEIAAEFAEEVGGPPTLAEFLEILGWAIPVNSDATDGTFTEPLKFKATLKGNKQYRNDQASRVPELNDHIFEDARQRNLELIERISTGNGTPVTPQQFAFAILQVLQTGLITLADVQGEDIRKLVADVPKKRIAKPRPGDILAIPARKGGYRLAVVLTQNRFGTARRDGPTPPSSAYLESFRCTPRTVWSRTGPGRSSAPTKACWPCSRPTPRSTTSRARGRASIRASSARRRRPMAR
jgi:hypothetical protein